MHDLAWLTIIALAALLARLCRDRPAPRGHDFLQLMNLGILPTSKKAHTRGDLDHHHNTRRQRSRGR